MGIKLNTNETNITVYDKINLDHATGSNIVSMISTTKQNVINTVLDIISDSLNLNDNEKLLYKVIALYLDDTKPINSPFDNCIDLDYLIKWISKDTNMSATTYRRACDTLIVKGIIKYVNDRRAITINDTYNVTNVTDTTEYIVIKIQPRIVNS